MVLTNPTRFNDIYELLKNDSIQGETVLLLVARDCDSIAACKIFTEILKSDLIAFNIKPVSGISDLEYVNENMLLDNEELKTIVMINCGGNIDVESTFTNLTSNQLVYIIDSHRPYHKRNIENEINAIIIDDGTYNEREEEINGDYDKEEEEYEDDFYDESSEDDEVDEEDENNDGENSDEEIFGKRKNIDEADEFVGDERTTKKKKKNTPKKNKRNSLNNADSPSKKNRRRGDGRSICSYYGKSAASMMYQLSSVLMKESLDGLLWYSILGMTDQLVHERVPLSDYTIEYKLLKSLVANSNSIGSKDDEYGNTNNQQSGGISYAEDYRFMLYRHWNLYESLYNSKYVACNLRVWKAKGRYLLETLFALMGLPLDQAKQKYSSMNSTFKSSLKKQLSLHAPKFGLDQLYFPSFAKKFGHSVELSASDMIYALTALLESDNYEDDASDAEIWEQNFWDAYDALSDNNLVLLKEGLNQARVLQKEITRQVASMIEKRIVTLSGPFRYAFLTETSDIKYFIHPMALTKLGLFMMDALIAMKKKPKPFLIGALNEVKDTYLIVGISGSLNTNQQTNEFGVNFREAAEMTNSTLKYQSFDTAVIEIGKLDMPKFIEHLHTSLMSEKFDENEQDS